MDITGHSQVGKSENPGLGVLVNGNDHLGFFDSGSVFIGTGNAAVDNQPGGNGFAGLADLPVMGQGPPVNNGPGCACGSANGTRKPVNNIKCFPLACTPAPGSARKCCTKTWR